MNKRLAWSIAALLLAAISLDAGEALAQLAVRAVIGTGATAAAGGTTIVVGTCGQPIIGVSTASSMEAGQGFWYAAPAGPASVSDPQAEEAGAVALVCWPNPLANGADLRIRTEQGGQVSLKLYDALGREVATLLDTRCAPGTYTAHLDASALASGRYLAHLVVGTRHTVLPIMIVK